MKAMVYERYGPPEVLHVKEIETPAPGHSEILVRARAATVTSGDCRVRSLNVPRGFGLFARLALGVSKPKQPILGTELAGVVEAVGKDVRKFKPGDEVFAFSDTGMGCYVEYKCMPEDGAVAHRPPNLSLDEAAALSFGGTTVLSFFRKGRLQSGERVLVNGASVRAEDLRFLAELAAEGAFTPVIDRRYPFAQIVEAHRYVDSGRKRGNVIITWGNDEV